MRARVADCRDSDASRHVEAHCLDFGVSRVRVHATTHCAQVFPSIGDDSVRADLRMLALASIPAAWLCLCMPVFAQEAYYWTYSQHPDLSYYDHPPMVAWMIWMGTSLLGDGAFGIRLLTLFCGIGTMAIGLLLLRSFGVSQRARATWLLCAACAPALLATRFLANPDPPLCLFWLASITALWRARDGGLRWWVLAGICAGLALLSKYTAAFLAVGGIVTLAFDPAMRRQLLRRGPWIAVSAAAAVFLPVVLWNVRNDFESFRFQTSNRFQQTSFHIGWLFEFLGAQFGMVHPAVALMLPFAIAWLARRAAARDMRALWLCAFGLPLPLFFLCNAPLMHVKPNWPTPGWLTLLLGVAIWSSEIRFAESKPRLARAARFALLGALPIALLAPVLVAWPQHRGSSWSGWEEIAASADKWAHELDREDGARGNVFLFASDYKDAAQLTHALHRECLGEGEHGCELSVLAQNVIGRPALQFDHWDQPSGHVGQSAVFVLPRAERRGIVLDAVRDRFGSAERVDHIDIERLGVHVFDADIYVCRGYKGPH